MDPLTLSLIMGGLGAWSGAKKADESREQQKQDLLRNAIEAESSWLLNPAYQAETKPIGKQGAVLSGAFSGAMQGMMLGNSMSGWEKATTPDAQLTMDSDVMANKLGESAAMEAADPMKYQTQLGVPGVSGPMAPARASLGVDTTLTAKDITAPQSYWGTSGAQGPTPWEAGGKLANLPGGRQRFMSTQNSPWTFQMKTAPDRFPADMRFMDPRRRY